MNLELMYAQWKMGELPPARLPSLAGDLMVRGHQGPAVMTMVSFHRPSRAELEGVFERVLEELGLPIPRETHCLLILAQNIAREIVERRLEPDDGASRVSGWADKLSGVRWRRDGTAEDRRILDLCSPGLSLDPDLEPPQGWKAYLTEWAWEVLEFSLPNSE
jgi:hypothetical protein